MSKLEKDILDLGIEVSERKNHSLDFLPLQKANTYTKEKIVSKIKKFFVNKTNEIIVGVIIVIIGTFICKLLGFI